MQPAGSNMPFHLFDQAAGTGQHVNITFRSAEIRAHLFDTQTHVLLFDVIVDAIFGAFTTQT